MITKRLSLAAAVVAILLWSTTFGRGEVAYMPTETAAAIIADGVPWSAESPNGRTFKLTLNKDGTGSIQALLFTLSVSWTVKGDAMCLSSTMMSKCLRFREIPGGLQSWVDAKPDLKLTR